MKNLLLVTCVIFYTSLWADTSFLPANCTNGKECVQELPGAFCGDGTASFFALTVKPKAKNLVVFLQGGGACWDYGTCTGGFVKSLTRTIPNNDWNNGKGIQNTKDSMSPFREDTVAFVPYCTGDIFGGTREMDYVSGSKKLKVRHQGYQNVVLTLQRLKVLYPNPERVTLIGESAGAMGTFFHLRNVANTYPNTPLYVISDSGIPFEPPYLDLAGQKKVMENWGSNFGTKATNLAELVEENVKMFPDIRFGLIASYYDYVMTIFARAVGSADFLKAVAGSLTNVSTKHIGLNQKHQKVYYIDGIQHTYLTKDYYDVESEGVRLRDWLSAMMRNEEGKWENVRPDLNHELRGYQDLDALVYSRQ